jgi:broad specificity phosphatase PhoE
VVLDELAEYDAEGLISRYLTRRRAGDQLADLATSHGLDRAGYQQLLEATGSAWIDGELDDGGESWPQFRARVELGIDSIRRREGRQRTIMAAVSAGVIGAVLGHVLGLTHRQTLAASWVIHNCSVTLLRYDQRRLSLASFNAVGHLERPGRPDLLTYR